MMNSFQIEKDITEIIAQNVKNIGMSKSRYFWLSNPGQIILKQKPLR